MSRWWCSWVQPGQDFRPVSWPMDMGFLGYWCTGESGDGSSMVAWVEAASPEEVRYMVETAWPEFKGQPWRIEPTEKPAAPGDRFPRPDWIAEDRWA